MSQASRGTSSREGGERKTRDSPQVFLPRANLFFRAFLISIPIFVVLGGLAWSRIAWSPLISEVGVPVDQPVLFSHRHHVGELKIDCRYCHTSVENSSFAGIPSTQVCMTCHSQLFTNSPLLAPVVRSAATGEPMRWNRVHILPDYVYFDHSIHVNKGVGCTTCHGQVDEMPFIEKEQTLYMAWCIDCHRDPGKGLRPLAQIYSMAWKPSPDQLSNSVAFTEEHHMDPQHLTNCSVCHR
jgi:hypothetical protein